MNIKYWQNFSKRNNSTKQPMGGTDLSVTLKTPTDIIRPTFLSASMPADTNYIQAFGRYYYVTDIRYTTNDLKEFECQIDVLSTYKTNILNSNFYVSYSSSANKTWLPDTRIPVFRNTKVDSVSYALNSVFDDDGFYVLAATGQNGCNLYALELNDLITLISRLSSWGSALVSDILTTPFDVSSVEHALESLSTIMTQTGVVGNAYVDAPHNIRSCIWVPFNKSRFEGGTMRIYLGQFDTGIDAPLLVTEPVSLGYPINIPWHYSDWRRMYEDVYLHLPFVGMVKLSSDSLTNVTQLTIGLSVTASDGCVAYQITAYNSFNVIGRYSGQCSANYPIGISQQASAGQILNSIAAGAEKVASVAIEGTQSLTSVPAGVAGVGIAAISAGYEVANAALTAHNTTIGGTGGGAGAGLSLDFQCYTVTHDLACNPADMAATMGRPMMEPMSLENLTGYCQCANASIELPATDPERMAINAFLNSGFFIE